MFTRPFPPTNKGTTSGLNPIANLDALLTTNTYPAKFLLHEITDSSETLLFQRFGIFSNSFGYPFQKEMSVRLNDSFNKNCYHSNGLGDPLEKTVIRSKGSGYPLEKIVIRSNSSRYPFKTIVSRTTLPFATSLSKNVRDGPFFF